MNDNGDEIPEDLKALIDNVTEILGILDDAKNTTLSMQILASCTAAILCNRISSEEEAQSVFGIFNEVVAQTISRAKSMNMTMWTKGTPH